MSSALITIVGKMQAADGEEQDVTITGLASIIGLYPGSPPPRPHPEPPLGIWGPTDPRPGYWVPGAPGAPGYGTGIWGPTDPRPGNPISGIPGLPGYEPPTGPHDPLFEKKVGWTPETGWVVVFVPTGEHVTPSK